MNSLISGEYCFGWKQCTVDSDAPTTANVIIKNSKVSDANDRQTSDSCWKKRKKPLLPLK